MTTREALKELRDNLAIHVIAAPMFGGDHCEINVMEVKAMIEEADAALKEPLRNCDVGVAEEQSERFRNFCKIESSASGGRCTGCRAICYGRNKCEFSWAQMPYEEGGDV